MLHIKLLYYIYIIIIIIIKGLHELRVEGRGDSHRKNAQQLLSVGDVRYHRLCAVEEEQEDVASVSSVAVNLLCCLLGQAAHHTLDPAYGIKQRFSKCKEGFCRGAADSFRRGSVYESTKK